QSWLKICLRLADQAEPAVRFRRSSRPDSRQSLEGSAFPGRARERGDSLDSSRERTMYDQAPRRKLRRPRTNAPAGVMQLHVFGPRGERLKHFLGDFCKALRK